MTQLEDFLAANIDRYTVPPTVTPDQVMFESVEDVGPDRGAAVLARLQGVADFTTLGILLSLTRARRIPGAHNLAMGIVYVFVAGMGARASLAGIGQAPAFLLGAFIWIFIHGAFCLFGAWLFRVDVHSAAGGQVHQVLLSHLGEAKPCVAQVRSRMHAVK